MKLRIRQNTLRLRLTKTEVDRLAKDGRVEESTVFSPSSALRYVLTTSDTVAALDASFTDGTIEIRVPTKTARAWATNEEVGLSGEVPVKDGTPLVLLVEKDFACLKERPGEDDSDAFPHPPGTPKRC